MTWQCILHNITQILLMCVTIFWLWLALTKDHITDSRWPFVAIFILMLNLQTKVFFIGRVMHMALK